MPSCVDIALAAGSPPRASWTELPRHRSFCEGPLAMGLSGHACRDLAFAARSPPRASCRSCRGIALAARSPPQGLTGVAAATSLLLRGRRSRASWAELPRHRSCRDVAAALRCVVLESVFLISRSWITLVRGERGMQQPSLRCQVRLYIEVLSMGMALGMFPWVCAIL